jgi:hypothetical protein
MGMRMSCLSITACLFSDRVAEREDLSLKKELNSG